MVNLRYICTPRCALAVFLAAVMPSATPAQEADGVAAAATEGEVAAFVHGVPVTVEEVSRTLAFLGGSLGADPETARERALELLVAERVLDRWVREEGGSLAGSLREALDETRRRMLFDVVARSSFEAPEPSEEEVAAFAKDNPHLFSNRVVYRFQRLVAAAEDPAVRARAEALVAEFSGDAPWNEADVQRLTEALSNLGAEVRVTNFWTGSEALGLETLARLERVASAEARRDVEAGEVIDLLVLYDRRAAPVAPALVAGEIADRLRAVAFQRHRWSVASDLASAALGREGDPSGVVSGARLNAAAEELVDRASDRRIWGVALGAVVASLGAAGVLCTAWIAKAKRRVQRLVDYGFDYSIPVWKSSSFAVACSATAILALALVLFLVGVRAHSLLGPRAAGVVAFGALVLGLAFGEITRRRLRKSRRH